MKQFLEIVPTFGVHVPKVGDIRGIPPETTNALAFWHL